MTECELSEKVKAGEKVAFGILYETYAEDLYVTILRYIEDSYQAKDLLHDCFLKIFDKITQFQYQGTGSLGAWLRRLCVNECLMKLRREKNFQFISLDERDDIEFNTFDEPTEEEVDQIPSAELSAMIQALPEGYRMVLTLYLIEGKSHKEIAALLGINEKSSSSQLSRAKKQLAKAIKEWHQRNR